MQRHTPALVRFAAAFALAICVGCAVSEPIDHDGISGQRGTGNAGSSAAGSSGSGAGGIDAAGIGGSTGGGAAGGGAGTFGSAGTTGSAGTGKMNSTSGQAGDGTSGGTGGAGSGNVSGQGGTGGGGGDGGRTGIAGRGGTTGSAGRGGATGSAGRGGATGSAGRGGAGGGGAVDAGSNTDGSSAATFTDIYTTIIVTYCSGSSCHSPGMAAGVSFASQSSAYTAVSARVTPGNGAGSAFYNTVNSGSMPRGAAKLSATNLAKIKAWIDAGALNN